MKIIVTSVLLILSQLCLSQTLISNWDMNKLITPTLKSVDDIRLISRNWHDNYNGSSHVLSFYEDGTFRSSYIPQCGNDCFKTTLGVYELKDDKYLKITLKAYYQSGFCEKRTIEYDLDLGTFEITKFTEDIIELVRLPELDN